MYEANMRFFCPKCRKSTDMVIKSEETEALSCYFCKEEFYADVLPMLALNLSKELNRLFKKHANIYAYTRIEFERDFQEHSSTSKFFFDEELAYQDKDISIYPPRFDIVAYQFKCIDTAARMFLHDDTIAYPRDYNIPAFFNFSYKFSEVMDEPYLMASYKDLLDYENNEFSELYLFEYTNLIHYTKLYNAYLRLFAREHKTFAYFVS